MSFKDLEKCQQCSRNNKQVAPIFGAKQPLQSRLPFGPSSWNFLLNSKLPEIIPKLPSNSYFSKKTVKREHEEN